MPRESATSIPSTRPYSSSPLSPHSALQSRCIGRSKRRTGITQRAAAEAAVGYAQPLGSPRLSRRGRGQPRIEAEAWDDSQCLSVTERVTQVSGENSWMGFPWVYVPRATSLQLIKCRSSDRPRQSWIKFKYGNYFQPIFQTSLSMQMIRRRSIKLGQWPRYIFSAADCAIILTAVHMELSPSRATISSGWLKRQNDERWYVGQPLRPVAFSWKNTRVICSGGYVEGIDVFSPPVTSVNNYWEHICSSQYKEQKEVK